MTRWRVLVVLACATLPDAQHNGRDDHGRHEGDKSDTEREQHVDKNHRTRPRGQVNQGRPTGSPNSPHRSESPVPGRPAPATP